MGFTDLDPGIPRGLKGELVREVAFKLAYDDEKCFEALTYVHESSLGSEPFVSQHSSTMNLRSRWCDELSVGTMNQQVAQWIGLAVQQIRWGCEE